MTQDFEYLDSLIGGWFHQDFDIDGSNPEEIMASYKAKTKPQEQEGLAHDIREYLAQHPDDTELADHFKRTFDPDLVDGAWGLTTREFLTKIESLLC